MWGSRVACISLLSYFLIFFTQTPCGLGALSGEGPGPSQAPTGWTHGRWLHSKFPQLEFPRKGTKWELEMFILALQHHWSGLKGRGTYTTEKLQDQLPSSGWTSESLLERGILCPEERDEGKWWISSVLKTWATIVSTVPSPSFQCPEWLANRAQSCFFKISVYALGAVAHACILGLQKGKQKDQEFEIILSYKSEFWAS